MAVACVGIPVPEADPLHDTKYTLQLMYGHIAGDDWTSNFEYSPTQPANENIYTNPILLKLDKGNATYSVYAKVFCDSDIEFNTDHLSGMVTLINSTQSSLSLTFQHEGKNIELEQLTLEEGDWSPLILKDNNGIKVLLIKLYHPTRQ